MYFSAKALRASTLAAALLAATFLSLISHPSPAQAQGLLQGMFGGSGQPGISIGDAEEGIQVDEACVLIRGGGELVSVGDRCPQKSSQDEREPNQPASEPTRQPGETTPETTTGTTTETTTGATTVGDDESGLQEVAVKRAVDGDTLEISPDLEGTDTVRLIGLDTPEMATDEAAVPEPYAEEAAAFTAESLEGEKVFLELDEGLKDDYGRLLAYAWLGDPVTDPGNAVLFNESLLREGYATLFTVEPNVLYEDRLAAAEDAARSEGLGIWGLGQPGTTGPVTETATTVPEAITETTTGGTTLSTTGEMTVADPQAKPQAVPAGDPDPLDLPEEGTQGPSSTSGQEPEALGGWTTVVASGNLPETTTGTTSGTTMGGTTVEDRESTGAETFDPETFDPETFDPEALKREATQLAQESLEEAGIEPPQVPEDLSSETPEVPAETPAAAPAAVPPAVPPSQMTEAPVSVLPDTGGPGIWIFGALALIAGLAGMAAFDRMTARASSVKEEGDHGSDDGSGR